MTSKPQFRCSMTPTRMDLHSIPEVKLPSVTQQKTSLHYLRQIQLHQISPKSQTHQMLHQNHSLKIDYKPFYRGRGHIHSVSTSPSIYQTEKHQKHEADLILYIKGLLYKHITDSNQKFWVLVILKAWKYTVLMEAHDKLGHQGATHTYCLIKHKYYWKGIKMNIRKSENTLCCRDKDKDQSYPLQMTEISQWPFNKMAIDLVTECGTSNSGNRHFLTIIDHFTGWPEAVHILDKSADTIVSTFINHHHPVHTCPRYILSDSGTKFKNQLMVQVLQQLGTDCLFSGLYHP